MMVSEWNLLFQGRIFKFSMLNTWDVSVLSNCGWWWTKMCEIREVWVEMVVATSVQVFFFSSL